MQSIDVVRWGCLVVLMAVAVVLAVVIAPDVWRLSAGPRHLAYARYLLRHKWFVGVACCQTGAGLWRGLVHDLSKLRPDEWGPYARCFYSSDGSGQYEPDESFDLAWLRHQHRNRHHWQYWVLREDSGKVLTLPMPERFIREMVANWMGAGRAQGQPDTQAWYEKNRERILLDPATREQVEQLLQKGS